MKKVVLISVMCVSLFANCQDEVNSMLDKVIFAKHNSSKSSHYVAYKQAEDAMRACRDRISDKDMWEIIAVKNKEKKAAGE